MTISSRFTGLVGCDLPIQLAALGKVGSTELAAAVAQAGRCGLGRAGHLQAGAAGGAAAAERFAELMRLGADAVRVGTRFVVCRESAAHPQYVDALLAARGEEDTVVTEWFGEGWEHAPHRVLRSALEAAQRSGWRKVPPPDRQVERDVSDMALYAGVSVGHINLVEPAAAVIADLVRPIYPRLGPWFEIEADLFNAS